MKVGNRVLGFPEACEGMTSTLQNSRRDLEHLFLTLAARSETKSKIEFEKRSEREKRKSFWKSSLGIRSENSQCAGAVRIRSAPAQLEGINRSFREQLRESL